MTGYDRRKSTGTPAQLVSQDVTNGVPNVRRTGKNLVKKVEVVSFRTHPEGEFIPEYTVDPYAWQFNATAARKRQDAIANGLSERDPNLFGNKTIKKKDLPLPVLDKGHPYSKVEQEILTSHNSTDYLCQRSGSGSNFKVRGGPLWAVSGQVAISQRYRIPFPLSAQGTTYTVGDSIPAVDIGDLAAIGGDAIGRVAPSSDGVDLPYMMAEALRDLPRVIGHSLLLPGASIWKMGASEFLNYVFGIAPTARDLAKLADSLMNLSQRILQIQRDVGRGVRRKYSYPIRSKDVTFASSDLSSYGQILLAQRSNAYGALASDDIARSISGVQSTELHAHEEIRDHFNGSFTYFLPRIPGFEARASRYMAAMNKLYHLQPSALAVYNLTPWSWLLDWCVDISSILRTNQAAQDDNLVINYGYITRVGIRTLRQSTTVSASSGISSGPTTVHTIRRAFRMTRMRANPYGFVPPIGSEFTPMRLAILLALGISRG